MGQCVLAFGDQLGCAPGGAADHRAAAGHSLGNHAAERLGLGAGVDQNVERPNSAGRIRNIAGESDPIGSGAALAASLRNATFVPVPEAGHYVPIEASMHLASLLRSAISAL